MRIKCVEVLNMGDSKSECTVEKSDATLTEIPESSDATLREVPDTVESELHAPPIKRVPHLHKLEKKHSSGDLHSRLKTRKLLGVGETDDGDVHRSKLSQILGHSDQLYIRLPPGLRIWQVAMAIIMTVMALWAFLFPRHLFTTMYEGEYENTLPIRLYGVALVCLSLMYWYTVNTVDKDMIRLLLLCSILFFTLHTIVSALCLPFVSTLCALPLLFLCVRLVCICVSVYFYWVFTRDWKISSKEHWRLYKQK